MKSLQEQLETRSSEYLSIGITADGSRIGSIAVPWKRTGHAFNMRTPDVYMTEQDLHDPQIRELMRRFHVDGCYLFTPLEDYTILGELTELRDLTIYRGDNLTDLDFLTKMPKLHMFYLQYATLDNLDPLFSMPTDFLSSLGRCVGFGGCTIRDISRLEHSDIQLAELVVLCPTGANEQQRWASVRAHDYQYGEYTPQ